MSAVLNDVLINDARLYIEDLFRGNSDGHDLDHSMRVYSVAMKIAKEEPDCDIEAVALAALLHDADDHKLFDTSDNANARAFLKAHHISDDRCGFICSIINSVSFSKNRGTRPVLPEAKIVQDADRLDAMGAIGIARTFAYGGSHGRSLDESIGHFHEKLLLLKDEMNTDAGRRIAQERHLFMEEYLEHFNSENTLV